MSMGFWTVLALMTFAAIGFAVWPMYRHKESLSPIIAVAVLFVVGLSSGLYYRQGNPSLPSGSAALPDMDDAISALAARLAENPDDISGWNMLGRSYMSVGDFPAAVAAFEKVVELDSAQDAQSLVSLGEALLANTGAGIEGRVAALFENALAIDPNNPQALFYGGIGAFNRNDNLQAANRWEQLLSLNPPAEIQGILQQRIAEWRGETPAATVNTESASQSGQTTAVAQSGAIVSARLSLTEAAAAALPAEATVFLIARDPAQPAPPIAVARRRLSELPLTVSLGDRESMVPGRSLSAFTEFELLARVSVSGQPAAQPGDWFGSQVVTPTQNNAIELPINQQVR